MNQLHELALPAAIHRITMLERERDEFNKKLEAVYTTMAQIRTELALKTPLTGKECMGGAIIVPDELRLTSIKGRRQKGNRQYHVVQKRWGLWREQLKTGISVHALARFWGVHHTAIVHAQENKFKARKADPTKNIKPL